MALVAATLQAALTPGFAAGLTTPGITRQKQAEMLADAYNTYAMTAQSCAGLPPSLVQSAVCKQMLVATFKKSPDGPIPPADDWSAAFEAFWTGGLFGASGVVLAVPGTAALKAQLIPLFSAFNVMPAFVSQLTSALDAFTRLVVVQDTLIPPPTGCVGPIL